MNDPRRERQATAAARLLLALLPLLLLAPVLFGGRLYVPYDLAAYPPASLLLPPAEVAALREHSNFDVTEVPIWFLPEWAFAREQIFAHGSFPGWNPCARNGTAIHGHGLLGLLYPPNWLMFLDADPAPLLGWVVWLDLAIAGLLAFGLFRHLGIGIVAALFGAVAFQLGGPLVANAPFWMRLGSLIWLPGMLWAQLCIADSPQRLPWRGMAALAVCIAMPWLSGFPPYALATTLLAMAFAVVLLLQRWRQGGTAAALRLGGALGIGGGLGVLLALPAVLPSLLFFAASARPQPTAAMLTANKFDWYGLLGLWLPDLFGHPSRLGLMPYDKSPLCLWLATVPGATGRPSNYNYTEYSLFAGTSTLFCAGLGAVRGRGRLRWFALLALLVALGIATCSPGFALLVQLPGMANIFPMRWLPPAMLLLAWLAALGCERLLLPRPGLRLLLVLAIVVAMLAFLCGRDLQPVAGDGPSLFQRWLPDALAAKYALPREQAIAFVDDASGTDRFTLAQQWLADGLSWLSLWTALVALWCGALLWAHRRGHRGTALAWLGTGVLALQLLLHGASLNRGQPGAVPVWTAVHQFLLEQRDAESARGGFAIARAAPSPTLPIQLPPGELLPARVRDLQFDSHYDARSPAPLLALFGRDVAAKTYVSATLPDDARLQHPLLDLLGVRYVLSTAPLQHAGSRCGPALRGPGGEFFVYRRDTALPRAFVVPALQQVADDAAAVQALVDPGFAPALRAVVTPEQAGKLHGFVDDAAAGARRVTFVQDEADTVVLHVTAGAGGCLVLADTWMPGWSAEIDGIDAPIARVDHSLRGVALPDRACTVRLHYSVPGLQTGANLAGLALLVLAAGLWWQRRSSRTSGSAESRV